MALCAEGSKIDEILAYFSDLFFHLASFFFQSLRTLLDWLGNILNDCPNFCEIHGCQPGARVSPSFSVVNDACSYGWFGDILNFS